MPIPVGLLLARAREHKKDDLRTTANLLGVSHNYVYQIEMLHKFCDDLPYEIQKKVITNLKNYILDYLPIENENYLDLYLNHLLQRDKLFLNDLNTFFYNIYVANHQLSKERLLENKSLLKKLLNIINHGNKVNEAALQSNITYDTFFTKILDFLFVNSSSGYYLNKFESKDINFYMQYIFDRAWGSRATKRQKARRIFDYEFTILNDEKYIGVLKGILIRSIIDADLYMPMLYLMLEGCRISTQVPRDPGETYEWRKGKNDTFRDVLVLNLPQGIYSFCFLSSYFYGDYFKIVQGDVTRPIE